MTKNNLISQWMNHTVSSRTARLHRVCLFLTRKLTQWQWVETVVFTQGVRFVYFGDKHLRIQLYPFGPTCPTLVICPTLLYKKKYTTPDCTVLQCNILQCVETCGDIWNSRLQLWPSSLELWPLPADSGEFSEIFYANILRKIDFCAQNIFFCAKVHKFGETKLIWVKKK